VAQDVQSLQVLGARPAVLLGRTTECKRSLMFRWPKTLKFAFESDSFIEGMRVKYADFCQYDHPVEAEFARNDDVPP
jgi:hypothetical protein